MFTPMPVIPTDFSRSFSLKLYEHFPLTTKFISSKMKDYKLNNRHKTQRLVVSLYIDVSPFPAFTRVFFEIPKPLGIAGVKYRNWKVGTVDLSTIFFGKLVGLGCWWFLDLLGFFWWKGLILRGTPRGPRGPKPPRKPCAEPLIEDKKYQPLLV